MPAACYKGLSGREDFPWFCNNCLSKTLNCIREVKSIEERCNEFMKKFEEQVNSRIYIYEFYNTHILKVYFGPIGRQYHMYHKSMPPFFPYYLLLS
jgi:uncharacterized protein YfbU (UPF0304 family)